MMIKRNKLLHYFMILISSFIMSFISCVKENRLDNQTVFIVGKERISLNTFRDFYELDPTFPGYHKGVDGLSEYVDLIIDKILSRKLAKQESIFDSIFYKNRLTYERKKSTIELFYKAKVKNKIQVSEKEIQNTFKKLSIQLHVKHLYSKDRIQANNYYKALMNGTPFDTLAKKVFAGIRKEEGGADLGIITWGDLKPSLETIAFSLTPGVFSKPVKSQWGYHILLVTDRKQNIMMTQEEYRNRHDQLLKKIKRRKEEKAAREYLKNYLDPFDIKVKKEAFIKIIQVLGMDSDNPQVHLQQNKPITDEQLSHIKVSLINHLDEPFMVSTKLNWSIEDFLNRVGSIPWDQRPNTYSARKFKDDIGVLIRNEFLLSDAIHDNIDKSSEIDSIMGRYEQELAFQYYLKKSYLNYKMPLDVSDYYANKVDKRADIKNVPKSILSGMNTPESYQLYYSRRELHQQLLSHFQDINIQINKELISKEAQKINWNKPVRMFTVPTN